MMSVCFFYHGQNFLSEQIKVLKGMQCEYYVMFQTVVTKYVQLLVRKNAKQDRDYILLLLLNLLIVVNVQLETERSIF